MSFAPKRSSVKIDQWRDPRWGAAVTPATGDEHQVTRLAEAVAREERAVEFYRKVEVKRAELRAAGWTVRPDPYREALAKEARTRLVKVRTKNLIVTMAITRKARGPRPLMGRAPRRTPRRASRRVVRVVRSSSRSGADGPPPSPDEPPGRRGPADQGGAP